MAQRSKLSVSYISERGGHGDCAGSAHANLALLGGNIVDGSRKWLRRARLRHYFRAAAVFPRRFSCFAMNKYEAERRCRHFAPLRCSVHARTARPIYANRVHQTPILGDANQRSDGNF
jgi:hypothetical protein